MATFHVCDICGKTLPDSKFEYGYLTLGPCSNVRDCRSIGKSNLAGFPIIPKMEVCFKCAETIFNNIENLKNDIEYL